MINKALRVGLAGILTLGFSALTPDAMAGVSKNTRIDLIEFEGNFMSVQTVVPVTGTRPSGITTGYTNRFKFDVTTNAGRAWESALLSVYLSGRLVDLYGTTNSTTGSPGYKAESLFTFYPH